MITEFLKTMRHAPCAQDTTFAEFYERFLEWLPKAHRPKWSRVKTSRELRRHRELFRGNSNVLMLVDHSFRFSYDQSANPERMARDRDRACWIDDGADGSWAYHDKTWTRVSIQNLIEALGWRGLNAEEIYRLRIEWRENPVVSLSFIEFFDRSYKRECGAAVALAEITRRFYSESSIQDSFDWQPHRIKRYLELKFPVASLDHETHIGNLAGPGSRIISDLPLVAAFGQLLPRDLREEEFPHRPGESRARIQTLTRNEMSARGWGKINLSYAEQMASLRTPGSES